MYFWHCWQKKSIATCKQDLRHWSNSPWAGIKSYLPPWLAFQFQINCYSLPSSYKEIFWRLVYTSVYSSDSLFSQAVRNNSVIGMHMIRLAASFTLTPRVFALLQVKAEILFVFFCFFKMMNWAQVKYRSLSLLLPGLQLIVKLIIKDKDFL